MNRPISTALLTLSASLASPFFTLAPASAVTVTVGSTAYDVSVVTRSYGGNEDLFQSPPTGKMPWWWSGDPADSAAGDLAAEFAQQVSNNLGVGPTPGYGPVFAYLFDGQINGISQSLSNPNSQLDVQISSTSRVSYAIATPLSPTSVPGPLPLFGAAAAFGWSRKLRRRVGGGSAPGGNHQD